MIKNMEDLFADTEIAICTINREPNYVHQTLASMYMGGLTPNAQVGLYVGNEDDSYVRCYGHHRNVIIRPTPDEDWLEISGQSPSKRLCYNYFRCLSQATKNNVLLLEDDLQFADGWAVYLAAVVRALSSQRCFLSLYTHLDYTGMTEPVKMRKPPFFGTQALFIPSDIRELLLKFHSQAGIQDQNPDYVINVFSQLHHVPILDITKPLVQHAGKISSMQSVWWHENPLFGKTLAFPS
jgi:hypothetical protein